MTLAELIATMPGEPTASDADVLAWLTADVAVVGAIGSRTLLRWGAAEARLDRLVKAKDAHLSDAVRSLGAAALLTVSRPDTELDMGDPAHVALVDALVAGGVLTAQDKIELVALATVQMPRWRAEGVSGIGGEMTLGKVEAVRGV